MRASLIVMAFTAFACNASGAAEDVRCLSTAGPKRVELEWHTFSTGDDEWFGGYVRYRGASHVIPIVLAETKVTSRTAGQQWTFRCKWLEISDGRISGEYGLYSRGANVYDFTYRDLRRPRKVAFSEVTSPAEDGKCKWE